MEVSVDAAKCRGFGVCVDTCPSIFQPDEEGFATVVGGGQVAPVDQAAAEEAARACPEQAIRVEG